MLTPDEQAALAAAEEACGDWNDLTDHDRDMFGRDVLPDLLALVERLQKRRAVACQECGGGYYGYCAACDGTGATWEDGE